MGGTDVRGARGALDRTEQHLGLVDVFDYGLDEDLEASGAIEYYRTTPPS